MKKWGFAAAAVAALGLGGAAHADSWSLAQAAAPYRGVSITVVGLDRPSYQAAQKLTPEFEKETGIKVTWDIFPYEDTLKEETLNFFSNSQQFDAILSDVVWPVNFADPGWVVPLKHFTDNPALADPDLDEKDFFRSGWQASPYTTRSTAFPSIPMPACFITTSRCCRRPASPPRHPPGSSCVTSTCQN
jgi:multiple sugar transport system substrate-binding protein